jgi:hypothetical protein
LGWDKDWWAGEIGEKCIEKFELWEIKAT